MAMPENILTEFDNVKVRGLDWSKVTMLLKKKDKELRRRYKNKERKKIKTSSFNQETESLIFLPVMYGYHEKVCDEKHFK